MRSQRSRCYVISTSCCKETERNSRSELDSHVFDESERSGGLAGRMGYPVSYHLSQVRALQQVGRSQLSAISSR